MEQIGVDQLTLFVNGDTDTSSSCQGWLSGVLEVFQNLQELHEVVCRALTPILSHFVQT